MSLLVTGCLPKRDISDENRWNSFNAAKKTYEQVKVNKTTVKELKKLGYDPYKSPNVRIDNFVKIKRMFLEFDLNFHIPESVDNCVKEKKRCTAYIVNVSRQHEKRVGNAILDILSFNRVTDISGWNFEAIFIMLDDVVIYKLWSGMPNVKQNIREKRPLGPLQDLSSSAGGVLVNIR